MNDPFINILPSIDVHGFTQDEALFAVDEYINDNIKLGNEKLVIIHGIGEGVLRKAINTHFKRDKRISRIYVYGSNLGLTIIELNIQK